jgi:hypothetical protein
MGRRNRRDKSKKFVTPWTDKAELWCAGAVLLFAFFLSAADWQTLYGVAAFLALPPLGLLAQIPLRAWYEERPDDQPQLFGMTILVPVILALAAHWAIDFLDFRFSEWMLVAVLVAIVLWIVPFSRRRDDAERARLETASVVLFFVLCYLDGAVKLLDVNLDTAAPTAYRASVTSKDVIDRWYLHRHFKSRPSFWVYYSAWSPDGRGGSLQVSEDDYVSAHVGTKICIRRHPGYLGLRWYEADLCR